MKNVKAQPHYTQFKIQPAEFIAANDLDYFQGNVVKYVCRYKGKNGLEDLHKAQHYLEMLIEKFETGQVDLSRYRPGGKDGKDKPVGRSSRNGGRDSRVSSPGPSRGRASGKSSPKNR